MISKLEGEREGRKKKIVNDQVFLKMLSLLF